MATPNFNIPELVTGQPGKEITHNDALRIIDGLLGGVLSRSTVSPPGSPSEGDAYIIPINATGAWTGQTNKLTIRVNGVWQFFTPSNRWGALFIKSDDAFFKWDGDSWEPIAAGAADMSRSVYDANLNDIVDEAEAIAGTPSANQYYGTDEDSIKGFHNLPIGGDGDMIKNIYDPDDDGVVVAAEVAEEIAGTPGNSQYYGTNPSGVKGFHNLPTITGGTGGIGDMLKSTYDTNNNNKVDIAENAEQLNGQQASFYLNRANHTGNIPAANVTGLPTTDETSGFIQTATNFDYPISAAAVFGFTITSLFIKSSSGTCTAQLRINGTAVTGISSVAVSSSGATASASGANTVVAGNRISLNISANSSAQNVEFTIAMQRTL